MSTHLRNWGIAILATGLFAVPGLALRAQTAPESAPQPPVPVAAASITPPIVETLNLRVTAYASEVDETDSTPFITADGDHVHDGIVATNLLPFGTKVMIPALFGDKVFTVDDRMNPKFSHSIDIWMSTRNAAVDFGVHTANVVVLGQTNDTNLSLK